MKTQSPKSIDAYIKLFPKDVQEKLQHIRSLFHELVPEAEETIAYQMPTFKLGGKNLAHFAAFKHHIGFYPTPSGISAFQKELNKYKNAKGSVQFPLDKPLPVTLMKKIIRYRVKEMKQK